MSQSKHLSFLTLTGFVLISGMACAAYAQSDMSGQTMPTGTAAAPDNSGMNANDTSKRVMTADQAGNKQSDVDMMQKIRQAVIGDPSLSTYAHNVKIIAKHGKVILKGPVTSAAEKQNIEAKATAVAGAGNVRDKLSVKNSD
jgi:osmotically-inducible protein OsmY